MAAAVIRPGWSKPRTILLASEIPANKKVFAIALAQAVKFGAELILFHAYDTLGASASPAPFCAPSAFWSLATL